MVSESARVSPGGHHRLRFLERDDFTGPTAGYHFKQLLVNSNIVWEEDVAGGPNDWHQVEVDVTSQVHDNGTASLAFRLMDKQGVANFGVRWRLKDLHGDGLDLSATLHAPAEWRVAQRGAFEAGFGPSLNRKGQASFHIPLVVMTAAQPVEFKLRHGEPASPQRIAQWLRMCLEAMQDHKCDGVAYCLDKEAGSPVFPLVQDLFREFKPR